MGLWGKIKKTAKKAWKGVKKGWKWTKRKLGGLFRSIIKIVFEIVWKVIGIFDLLLGFLTWPQKKMRLHVVILTNKDGNPTIMPADIEPSIKFAKDLLKEKFNVKLSSYGKDYVEIINEPAPSYALNVRCDFGAFKDEYAAAGEYFEKHMAGWDDKGISLKFPITAFIVANVEDKGGCSLGALTDYITLDPPGIKIESLMMHEIGHSCGHIGHITRKSNFMHAHDERKRGVFKWQKNILRSSRHVNYY